MEQFLPDGSTQGPRPASRIKGFLKDGYEVGEYNRTRLLDAAAWLRKAVAYCSERAHHSAMLQDLRIHPEPSDAGGGS